jgi:hypothetical protein
MDAHFSKDLLRRDLDSLTNHCAAGGPRDFDGQANCAEARFEVDQTVQHRAHLAHLHQQASN